MNEYIVTVDNQKKLVQFINGTEIFVDNVRYDYELITIDNGIYILRLNNRFYELTGEIKSGSGSLITAGSDTFEIMVRSALQEKAAGLIDQKNAASHKMEVKAPMPGMIVKVRVQEGEEVKNGDAVMILEAMKMENEVRSPFNGILKKIYIKEGLAVEKGANLFLIE